MSNVVLLLRSPCSPGFTMQQMLDSKGRNPKTPQMQESQSAHLSLSTQLETMNVDYYKKSGVGISLPYKLNRSIFEWHKTLPVKENPHKMLVFFCERSHSLRSEHEELIFIELFGHGSCQKSGHKILRCFLKTLRHQEKNTATTGRSKYQLLKIIPATKQSWLVPLTFKVWNRKRYPHLPF